MSRKHRRRIGARDEIRSLRDTGISIRDIAQATGFGQCSIRKWLKFRASKTMRHGEIDSLDLFVYRAIMVSPAAFDFQIGLVHSPG